MMDIKQKMVFAVAPTAEGPVLMIGIPDGAWADFNSEAGKTQTMDLARIGIPLRLMVYGGGSHSDCLKVITDTCAANGITLDDRRREDFGIRTATSSDDSPAE